MFDAEPTAAATKAGDDFVRDHQYLEVIANVPHPREPAERRNDEAAGALHGFEDNRGDRFRIRGAYRFRERIGAAAYQLLVRTCTSLSERAGNRHFREAAPL